MNRTENPLEEVVDENGRLSMRVLMTPDMVNFSGKVHGGVLLKYLDQVASICGTRYAGTYVVTLSVDRVDFIAPIQVGELVTFQASVNYTGRTSLEVGIRVLSENLQEQSVRHTNSSYFTMVAIGDNNKPTPVPEFKPSDTIERRRFREAHQRRNDRMRRARIRRDRRERNPLDLLPA
jgi:acyl-CoA hydrolase